MRKVILYSMLLIAGLIVSQLLGDTGAYTIKVLTMFTLAFIMIHVGYEFEINKNKPLTYAWDYVVAATAATFPWIFCALYFVYVMSPSELWTHPDLWTESLLEARFSSPTSAGVLFSMLAAAGLAATWVFKKARILAIFDDLDTILLMVPLTFLMVGFKWQLVVVVLLIIILLYLAWKYLHVFHIPISWSYVLGYSALITVLAEAVYVGSKYIDKSVPIHLEVLLPAFVLGCMIALPEKTDSKIPDANDNHHPVLEKRTGKIVMTLVSACFMVLVGLSMPSIQTSADAPLAESRHEVELEKQPQKSPHLQYAGVPAEVLAEKQAFPSWGIIAVHVLAITVLSNLGKMFPVFFYRREASLRERLAVAVCMFPRGEVGAGVLVISLSYGLTGPTITVAVLSLALNLLCTGMFIVAVKKLIARSDEQASQFNSKGHDDTRMNVNNEPKVCLSCHN
jgi:Kef-type K+ transport system membrane component KefB